MLPFFWIIVIAFLIIYKPWKWHNKKENYADDHAEKILKERFAKGEIDEKDFMDRMSTLQRLHPRN